MYKSILEGSIIGAALGMLCAMIAAQQRSLGPSASILLTAITMSYTAASFLYASEKTPRGY